MSDAPRDENNIPGLLAVLNTDTVQGTTKVPIAITPSGVILADPFATISFTMQPVDPRDQNYVGCWLFEGLDGLTYPAVVTAEGRLLIDI